jgi:hypothetical protein
MMFIVCVDCLFEFIYVGFFSLGKWSIVAYSFIRFLTFCYCMLASMVLCLDIFVGSSVLFTCMV